MESLQNKVRVLEMSQVAPPLGSVTKASLPLTFFDLPLLFRSPAELLFFYSFPIQITHFMNSLVPQIKHSLSLTLQNFYPLAGNLTWTSQAGKPIISYEDGDSVTLTIAESNANFNHLSGYHARDPKDFNPLIPQLLTSKNKQVPVLAIQVTLFPNSGICMGVTLLHAAVDGRTTAFFLKSWASVSARLGINPSSLHHNLPLPFYERTVIKDTIGLEERYLKRLKQFIHSRSMSEYDCNNWLILSKNLNPPENQVAATFELSEADITRLKKRALLLATDHPVLLENDPTRFEIVCAFIWVCLAKARDQEGSDDRDEEAFILFVVDYRGRLDPPLPATYFGNCILNIKVSAKKSDIVGKDGIVVAVSSIRKEIKVLSSGLVKNLEARFSRLLSNNSGPQRYDVISGSAQFGLYEVDFGWGRPKKVEMPTIALTGAIFYADSSKEFGRGVEISLVRGKKEMDAFALNFVNGLNDLVVSSKKVFSAL